MVKLPDIIPDSFTVELRGVAVPIRGFTWMELGKIIAAKPSLGDALFGNLPMVAIMGDAEFLQQALAMCADLDPESLPGLSQQEQVTLLTRILELTIKDAIGPFAKMAVGLAERQEDLGVVLLGIAGPASTKASSPQSASLSENTAPTK